MNRTTQPLFVSRSLLEMHEKKRNLIFLQNQQIVGRGGALTQNGLKQVSWGVALFSLFPFKSTKRMQHNNASKRNDPVTFCFLFSFFQGMAWHGIPMEEERALEREMYASILIFPSSPPWPSFTSFPSSLVYLSIVPIYFSFPLHLSYLTVCVYIPSSSLSLFL